MNIPPSESATVTADGTIVSNLNFMIHAVICSFLQRVSRDQNRQRVLGCGALDTALSTGLTTADERWRIKLLRPTYEIEVSEEAKLDLLHYSAFERKIITSGIREQLAESTHGGNKEPQASA
jgi:hypothetical protein